MNRIKLKSSFYRFLLGREWRCRSEGKVKPHSHLHFSKKPLSVAQHYKDVIKIMLLLDDWLCIQLLFCKTGQDRLYKRSSSDVNTLPQNTGISKITHPVVENVEVKGSYEHSTVNSRKHLFPFNFTVYSPWTGTCDILLAVENAMANVMALFDISD